MHDAAYYSAVLVLLTVSLGFISAGLYIWFLIKNYKDMKRGRELRKIIALRKMQENPELYPEGSLPEPRKKIREPLL